MGEGTFFPVGCVVAIDGSAIGLSLGSDEHGGVLVFVPNRGYAKYPEHRLFRLHIKWEAIHDAILFPTLDTRGPFAGIGQHIGVGNPTGLPNRVHAEMARTTP